MIVLPWFPDPVKSLENVIPPEIEDSEESEREETRGAEEDTPGAEEVTAEEETNAEEDCAAASATSVKEAEDRIMSRLG